MSGCSSKLQACQPTCRAASASAFDAGRADDDKTNVGMGPWWHGRPTSATVPREVQRRGARTGALPPRALGPCTDVFEHLAARVLAATAFLGAGVHYFIRRMDVAGLPAADAGLGAALANDV